MGQPFRTSRSTAERGNIEGAPGLEFSLIGLILRMVIAELSRSGILGR
jgi:hypothetical protein